MTPERVIGKNGGLPWKLPADLRSFRKRTMGHPVIMGRKTFESIGKPLDGRLNIVLSLSNDYVAEGCLVVRSPEEALRRAVRASDLSIDPKEIMVIGGAAVFEAFLPRAGRLYVTWVHASIDGDTFFPPTDWSLWQEVERADHRADERNPHDYSFVVLEPRPRPST